MCGASAVIDPTARLRASHRNFGFKQGALTVFTLLTLAAATGCSDAVAPAARNLRPPPVPLRSLQALPQASQSLPFTPQSRVLLASYPFKEGALVEGRIQGTISVSSDAQASCVHANGAVDYLGVWIYCSGGQCAWSAGISASQGTTPSLLACSGRPNEPRYTSNLEWRDTILVGGIGGNDGVYAVRGGGIA